MTPQSTHSFLKMALDLTRKCVLQFAATHCAFAAIVIVLLLVACVQSKISSKEGSYRRTINTINAVSTRSLLLFWLMGSND